MQSSSRSARLTAVALALATGLTAVLTLGAGGAVADHADGADTTAERVARHSLRGPVTDENFYFVMADRFANGSTANDTGGLGSDRLVSGFDPTHRGFYNGGDLPGLRSKLDYIQGLGIDSIWLTPSFKNKAVQLEDGPSAGYHGYWITDFTQIDPHLGSNADLAGLIEDAHDRGMKVYFDIITNHTADVIGYEEGARTAYIPKDTEPYRTAGGQVFDDRDYAGTGSFPALSPTTSFPYSPVLEPSEENLKVPAWLNDRRYYHNRGNTTFTGEDSQYGDFFGLDDLFTEHPVVLDGMMDIYKTWIKDYGIDGFRIDTMKHVDDEFWQKFGPGLVSYAKANGKPDFFMFGEVFDITKSYTSHFTTHDRMQAILDFPFQEAARTFASKSGDNQALRTFFEGDDWYTDANSNVYDLPTFLGNHDMGRIGHFVDADNTVNGVRAPESELLRRDRLAHELMFLSRGNPVIYYGDEQGFTGTGGDQVARQTMFASQVPEYLDDDLLGTTRSHAQDNFRTDHPGYQLIRQLSGIVRRHPALRDGAHQMRYASDGPGIAAFSRVDREQQREYVVALNNSESAQSAMVPTYAGDAGFRKVYGPGPAAKTTSANGRLSVALPPLSATVYRANAPIAASEQAPEIVLEEPEPAGASRGRMHVAASVDGDSFYEVTFQARIGSGGWRTIGTDDTAPYQVFHDTSNEPTGRALRYRAVVLDNDGHARMSNRQTTDVPSPSITLTSPTDGGEVTRIDPVTLNAVVDPERPAQAVRFWRSVEGGAWELVGLDRTSPAYLATDDVSDLPLGTSVRYRAVLIEGSSPRVSDVVSVTTALPRPARDTVTLVGDLQSEAGCPTDWDPACVQSRLAFDTSDGKWHGTFSLPASTSVPGGSYSWKVAIDGAWDENYGAGGAAGGDNLALTVPAGGGDYTFTWDQVTKVPSVEPDD